MKKSRFIRVVFLLMTFSVNILFAVDEASSALEWNAASAAILSLNSSNPDIVFPDANLDDYEPVYAYFNEGNRSNKRYFVSPDMWRQILRAYNVVRSEENGAQVMTVQFQGVLRTTTTLPYTASITVKFVQNGSDITAYQVSAYSLKPLDVELGLDIDAMAASGNERVLPRAYKNEGYGSCQFFNLTTIAMRKPGAEVEHAVKNGGSVSGEISGNGVVRVSGAEADVSLREGYLPDQTWVVVAENRNLADLDEVSGVYRFGDNFEEQKAFNLKYTDAHKDYFGCKSCQFQFYIAQNDSLLIVCLPVRFRQKGQNVEAMTSRWWMYYITKSDGGADQMKLGMDFEKYDDNTVPKRRIYGNDTLAEADADTGKMGVKDIKLKFHSRPTVAIDGYMPNLFDDGVDKWTVVAENHSLRDLVEMEAFYHNGQNSGYHVKGGNLSIAADGKSATVQFQDKPGDLLACIGVNLRQTGNNIEARTGRYLNWYFRTAEDPELVYGFDFFNYKNHTTATRNTYGKGSFAASDSALQRGIKDVRMRFATEGIAYSAVSTAKYGNELVFSGSESNPLAVRTVSSAVFPSNGVVCVNPYATLTLSGHVANPLWTKYRVMKNGVLKTKGTGQIAAFEQIDLEGGRLSIREDEADAIDSVDYINFVTLKDGARVTGKLARVLKDRAKANWIVAGDSPSYCESGIMVLAVGKDIESTFNINVNDVAEGSDFILSGPLVDYYTVYPTATEHWNVHIVKNGEGTMEVSGEVTLPNEVCVSNGVLRLAGDNLFKVSRKRKETGENKAASVWLAGGALETAPNTVNTLDLEIKSEGTSIDMGDGATLIVSSIAYSDGASILVSGNIGKTATLRIENATKADLSRIRCGEDRLRVRLAADGSVEPYFNAFHISIR